MKLDILRYKAFDSLSNGTYILMGLRFSLANSEGGFKLRKASDSPFVPVNQHIRVI